jgi:CDGSH-type Zn-finger protein/truncated hemoglobin YjbI
MGETEIGAAAGTDHPRTPAELSSALSRAAGTALALAATYLYASYSLKSHPDEGGLTEPQAGLVRGWKRQLAAAGAGQLATLARAAALRRTLGGSATSPPPAPVRAGAGPFSDRLLDRLADPEPDPAGTVAAAARELAVDLPPVEALTPWLPDPDAAAADWREVQLAYRAAVAEAERTGTAFAPVRSVVAGPTVAGPAPDHTVISDELTRAVAELFNNAWETTMVLLARSVPGGAAAPDQADGRAACQLLSAVVRPLGEALTRLPVGGTQPPEVCAGPTFADLIPGGDITGAGIPGARPVAPARRDERLWRMALDATRLALRPGLPTEVLEAAAALQDLASRSTPAEGGPDRAARLAELRTIQAHVPADIRTAAGGPYLVTNVDDLRTALGEPIPTLPLIALCRCGQSRNKPFCDGSHARVDFTDHRDPRRVTDRRDTYHGLQATILDNRGLCAHSGYCTDQLPTVFRLEEEPFVAPSGGRLDDIVRAARACPSGALSYAIGGQEARNQVDQERPPSIEVTQDGPYRVTGGIPLTDARGDDQPRLAGASREHYSLCRCGHSQNKPFCSGMHWNVDFHDPPPLAEPTLFQWAGGLPALLRMTRLFYTKYVPEDPLLAPMFASMSPDHPDRVAAWLGEVFEGPNYYSEQYGGYPRMISEHIGKQITEAHRARWVSLMHRAADDARLPADPEFRAAFVAYLEWGSRIAMENSAGAARPPQKMPIPKWWWVCEATPYARASAFAHLEETDPPATLPAEGEAVTFAAHIRPLFRTRDRQSMRFAFDLWDYEQARDHAAGILARLQQGTMPCDGAWPAEQVHVFQRWVDSGMVA